MVEWDEERANFSSYMTDLISVGGGRGHREVVIAVCSAFTIKLGSFKCSSICDRSIKSEWHNANHAKACCNRCLCDGLEVMATSSSNARNKCSDINQPCQKKVR